jgi:AcrR family transcriptional regulator
VTVNPQPAIVDDEPMGVNRESIARQNQATRDALLAAVLSLLDRGSDEELSYQAIATEARVSERTVFRYFPSHAALREALVPVIRERLANVEPPDTAGGIVPYVERLYRICEANAGLVRALVNTGLGRAILQGERARRLDKLLHTLARAAPDREPGELRRAAALIRHQASGAAWDFYRNQAKLSLDDAIGAATLAVGAALESVGAVPSRRAARRGSSSRSGGPKTVA